MGIEVKRLRLRGRVERPHHSAFLIEDALKTEISDDQRLILVRQIKLQPMTVGDQTALAKQRRLAENISAVWRNLLANACHGSVDHASSANIVWFANSHEAKACLLARLLKNQNTDAWFWRLAVPEWKGLQPAEFVAQEMAAANDQLSFNDALQLLTIAVDHGDAVIIQSIVELYLGTGFALNPALSRSIGIASLVAVQIDEHQSRGEFGDVSPSDLTPVAEQIARQLERIAPPKLHWLCVTLSAHFETSSQAVIFLRAVILTVAPELALKHELLNEAAIALFRLLNPTQQSIAVSREQISAPTAVSANKPSPPEPNIMPAQRLHEAGDISAAVEGEYSASSPLPNLSAKTDIADSNRDFPHAQSFNPSELKSEAAGIFYVVNVLRELDWPKWLSCHATLLVDKPTMQLLRHILVQHKFPPNDASTAFFNEQLPSDYRPVARDILEMWRKAIDRWCRRHLKMNLATLVRKLGWLTPMQGGLTVRFALSDISLEVRRKAMDRDPGWVEWMGQTIRFIFSDRAIISDTSYGA